MTTTQDALNGCSHGVIWIPFAEDATLAMGEDAVIEFDGKHPLPIFVDGDDYKRFTSLGKVSITAHSLLIGSLLGYQNPLPTCDNVDGLREFLGEIINLLTDKAFEKVSITMLLSVSHWLRENFGYDLVRTALQTSMELKPAEQCFKCDYLATIWMMTEHAEGDERTELLEEVDALYRSIDLTAIPMAQRNWISRVSNAAMEMLEERGGTSSS